MSAVRDKEAWRYSERAWQALHSHEFLPARPVELPTSLAQAFDWPETRADRIVFVNGESTSDVEIRLRDGERLHLVFASIPGEHATRWRREFAIALEHGSAEIVEQHIGASGAEALGELTSQVRLGSRARLRVTTICDLPDSVSLYRRENISIENHGNYASTHALFGGRMQRFDLDVALTGAQARFASAGTFAMRGREHVDVHLDVRHAARDTHSDVSWRGVADQRARGIFHGAIVVDAGADGTDARLQTRNLLLSEHAEIDAQPVLEIHADEVKASHGATVGRLDERALFYLRSRGVSLPEARALLIAAFCREIFDGLSDAALRERLDAALLLHLPLEARA